MKLNKSIIFAGLLSVNSQTTGSDIQENAVQSSGMNTPSAQEIVEVQQDISNNIEVLLGQSEGENFIPEAEIIRDSSLKEFGSVTKNGIKINQKKIYDYADKSWASRRILENTIIENERGSYGFLHSCSNIDTESCYSIQVGEMFGDFASFEHLGEQFLDYREDSHEVGITIATFLYMASNYQKNSTHIKSQIYEVIKEIDVSSFVNLKISHPNYSDLNSQQYIEKFMAYKDYRKSLLNYSYKIGNTSIIQLIQRYEKTNVRYDKSNYIISQLFSEVFQMDFSQENALELLNQIRIDHRDYSDSFQEFISGYREEFYKEIRNNFSKEDFLKMVSLGVLKNENQVIELAHNNIY
ncbi:MAG: hypothetical protein GY828_08485 [Candidatus Gracilibacteria bacterium]|nr:hypothetical protein [Candidatus Gracilibacteria bacterium]